VHEKLGKLGLAVDENCIYLQKGNIATPWFAGRSKQPK